MSIPEEQANGSNTMTNSKSNDFINTKENTAHRPFHKRFQTRSNSVAHLNLPPPPINIPPPPKKIPPPPPKKNTSFCLPPKNIPAPPRNIPAPPKKPPLPPKNIPPPPKDLPPPPDKIKSRRKPNYVLKRRMTYSYASAPNFIEDLDTILTFPAVGDVGNGTGGMYRRATLEEERSVENKKDLTASSLSIDDPTRLDEDGLWRKFPESMSVEQLEKEIGELKRKLAIVRGQNNKINHEKSELHDKLLSLQNSIIDLRMNLDDADSSDN